VAAFLDGRIGFRRIGDVIAATLERTALTAVDSLEAVLAADAEGRRCARVEIERHHAVRSGNKR
jgi:1-deoxy-D-xylulose-5-phosphate reductoisomerase